MSNFKGTKGPWKLEDENIFSQNGELLASAFGEGYDNDYQYTDATYANAKLISKAPEMLEMLEKLQSMFKELNVRMLANEIEKLIKEATEL